MHLLDVPAVLGKIDPPHEQLLPEHSALLPQSVAREQPLMIGSFQALWRAIETYANRLLADFLPGARAVPGPLTERAPRSDGQRSFSHDCPSRH